MKALTNADIGYWLESARKAMGLSQEQVAKELGIPRPAISLIEAGKRSVSSIELDSFAHLYHRSTSYFLKSSSHDQAEGEALLLRAENVSEDDRPVLYDFVSFCERYADLEEVVFGKVVSEPSDRAKYVPSRSTRVIDLIKEGERVARDERGRLGLGRAPIRNIVDLLESRGIKVIPKNIQDSNISGCFYISAKTGPCIMLNRAENKQRVNFSAAHEYCHYLLDTDMSGYVCLNTLSNDEMKPFEVRANAFAAEFLMPKEGIKEFFAELGVDKSDNLKIDNVVHVQNYFGVSFKAMLYRLQNTGWISQGQMKELDNSSALAKHLAEHWYRYNDDEEKHVPEKLPRRYVRLALTAYINGDISLRKLAEYLDKPFDEVRQMVSDIENLHGDVVYQVF